MKKTIKLIILAVVVLISTYSFYRSFLGAINWYCVLKESEELSSFQSNWNSLQLLFSYCLSSAFAIVLAVISFIDTLKSSNAHHAARLTYEEYKERAKQKKLEKTRKKMQELEEKLQKESTE